MPQLLGCKATAVEAEGAKKPADAVGVEEVTVVDVAKLPSDAETSDGAAAQEADSEPSNLTLFLLCAVGVLEGVDAQLLPASMYALQHDIELQLTDLAYLTVAQGVMLDLAAPLWGILAHRRCLKRRSILVIGSFGTGLVSIALAFSYKLWPMIVLRAFQGALLGALMPISNGIVADVTSEGKRGRVFGTVYCALLVGMFLSAMVVGNVSRRSVAGVEGWRAAFALVGCLAVAVAGLEWRFLEEPEARDSGRRAADPRPQPQGRRCGCLRAISEEAGDLAGLLAIPTFCVMIVQGIFAAIPRRVMGNAMLYFQLGGVEDGKATILAAAQPVAAALGNALGGRVADLLAGRCGYHGRPLSAQISVAAGIPLVWLIFGGVPPGGGSFGGYLALVAAFGLLGSWAQSGTNLPVLSEVVPADARSRAMAWEGALENSVASLLGAPAAALLATRVFGYELGGHGGGQVDLAAAGALGRAMQATICIPWCVTLAAYALLHWSYPRDVRRLERKTEGQGQQPRAREAAVAAD